MRIKLSTTVLQWSTIVFAILLILVVIKDSLKKPVSVETITDPTDFTNVDIENTTIAESTTFVATYEYEAVTLNLKYYPKTWLREFRTSWENTSCQMQCDKMFDNDRSCTGYHFVDEYLCAFLFLDPEVFSSTLDKSPPNIKIMARIELKQGYVVLAIGGDVRPVPTFWFLADIIAINDGTFCSKVLKDTPVLNNRNILTMIGNRAVLCYNANTKIPIKCYYYNFITGDWILFTRGLFSHVSSSATVYDNRMWVVDQTKAEFYDAQLDIWSSMPDFPTTSTLTCQVQWKKYVLVVNYNIIYAFDTVKLQWKLFYVIDAPPVWLWICILIPHTDYFIAVAPGKSYGLNLESFERLTVATQDINYHALFHAGSRVYLIGGTVPNGTILELNYANVNDMTWQKSPYPGLVQARNYAQVLPLPRFLFNCT